MEPDSQTFGIVRDLVDRVVAVPEPDDRPGDARPRRARSTASRRARPRRPWPALISGARSAAAASASVVGPDADRRRACPDETRVTAATTIRHMSRVAIFGAGPIGSAIAQRLAERSRIDDILLIDDNAGVAAGKALDIRQSGPDRRLGHATVRRPPIRSPRPARTSSSSPTTRRTAPWDGERGLALIERLVRAGVDRAASCFAAPSQTRADGNRGRANCTWRPIG